MLNCVLSRCVSGGKRAPYSNMVVVRDWMAWSMCCVVETLGSGSLGIMTSSSNVLKSMKVQLGGDN